MKFLTKNANGKLGKTRDKSMKSLYESNLRRYEMHEPMTERKTKHVSSKRSLHTSHWEFYDRMQKMEEKRTQKMLKLMIDKEKREISQIKSINGDKKRLDSAI